MTSKTGLVTMLCLSVDRIHERKVVEFDSFGSGDADMLLSISIAVMALVGVTLLWGLVRLRKGNAQASAAIRKVQLEDLPALVDEGRKGLARAYGITIDFADREAAAWILDRLFADQLKLKDTFAKEGFYWRFVLPVGALVGEFICVHAHGVWKQGPDGVFMDIPLKNGVATCNPFDKTLKLVNGYCAKGDLYAFLQLCSSPLSSLDGAI